MAMKTSLPMQIFCFHLHLRLHFIIITVVIVTINTNGMSKIYSVKADNCAPTNCSVNLINLTYPFGVDPSSCGLSRDFLLSNCNSNTKLPTWKNFDCGNSSGCVKLGPPMVSAIYDQPSGLKTIQGRRDQLGASNRDFGFVNLTWIDGGQGKSQTGIPFCNPIPMRDVFDQYLPEFINLSSFANSTLNFSPYSVFLLFNCSKWNVSLGKKLSLAIRTDSSLCQSYRAFCGVNVTSERSERSNESFASCLQITPWKSLMLHEVVETLGCTNFTFFVNITNSALNVAWNNSSGGSPPRPPTNVTTRIQLMWSHADFTSEGDCQDCQRTGGWCGYDNITGSFKCFCPGNVTSNTNCSSSSIEIPMLTVHKSNALVIGTVITSVGAILCGVAFFLSVWWRKRWSEIGITAYSSPHKKNLWTSRRALSLAARYSPSSNNCKEFSYEELMQSTDGFATESMVADGGFGEVFFGVLKDGRKVAVKRLYHDNSRRLEQFYNEIRILSSLEHPNLVKLYGFCCFEQRDLMLVYEYVGKGSLANHLHSIKKPTIPWRLRLRIGYETAEALCYLHNSVSPPIYHRDVKTANILIDEEFHVKLGDFGLSRFVPIDVTHVSTVPQGTPGYVDPDYHKCYQLTEKSDVYSFGVVLMELVSGKMAVDTARGKGQVNLSSWAVRKIVCESWDELVDARLGDMDHNMEKTIRSVGELAFTCLQPEKDDRPSMHHVVQVLSRLCRQLDGDYN